MIEEILMVISGDIGWLMFEVAMLTVICIIVVCAITYFINRVDKRLSDIEKRLIRKS